MNTITTAATKVTQAMQTKLTAMSVAFMSVLVTFMAPRARSARALSFLEYAILAAAIVGIGVVIANFFGDSLGILNDDIEQGFNQRN